MIPVGLGKLGYIFDDLYVNGVLVLWCFGSFLIYISPREDAKIASTLSLSSSCFIHYFVYFVFRQSLPSQWKGLVDESHNRSWLGTMISFCLLSTHVSTGVVHLIVSVKVQGLDINPKASSPKQST